MDESAIQKIKMDLGLQIRSLRANKGLSQDTLALACGLDRTYVGGIERGERNPSLVNLYKIANALEVSMCELFR